jgi:hypothetical protein
VAEQKSSEEIARTLKLDKGLGLARLVGTSPARELMFLSDRIDARHCETPGGGARLHGQAQTCLYRAVKPPTALAIKAIMRDLS